MNLELVPIGLDVDVEAVAAEIAPAYGGDAAMPREILVQTRNLLIRDPRPDPWGCYLARKRENYIGACGFKSAPDAQGAVEIAYTTFPFYGGRGWARAMTAALTSRAFEAGAPLVVAHTLPEENASSRCLRRNGFAFAGEVVDPEDGPVWRWEKRP